jgi:Protein of unknown function (DUF2591)
MLIETKNLTGKALDWAVAKFEGYTAHIKSDGVVYTHPTGNWHRDENWKPSSNWFQGGPIIEREKITPHADFDEWVAQAWQSNVTESGETLLVAAMRCYVSMKAGDSIEIPEELC